MNKSTIETEKPCTLAGYVLKKRKTHETNDQDSPHLMWHVAMATGMIDIWKWRSTAVWLFNSCSSLNDLLVE
jgi:hypothetical protein